MYGLDIFVLVMTQDVTNNDDSCTAASTLTVLNISRLLPDSVGCGIRTYLSMAAMAVEPLGVSYSYAALLPGQVPEQASSRRTNYVGRADMPECANAFFLWRWLRRAVKEHDVVNIHGVLGYQFLLGAVVCLIKRVPYVVCPHGSLDPWFLRQRKVKSFIYLRLVGRFLLKKADAIIVTSPMESESVHRIVPTANVRVVVPGVELPVDEHAGRVDADDADVLKILFMSRMAVKKGIPRLLEAVRLLVSSGIKVKLLVVGSGTPEYESKIKALVVDKGLHSTVVFHGYLEGSDKINIMNESHVFVLHSDTENFGFSVGEAMALGMPVVVSEAVALRDIIQKYGAGSVVPVDSAEGLADALLEYRNGSIRRARGRRARDAARSEFSLSVMGEGLHKIYSEALLPLSDR